MYCSIKPSENNQVHCWYFLACVLLEQMTKNIDHMKSKKYLLLSDKNITRGPIKFFLNVFTEFTDKNIQHKKLLNPGSPVCRLEYYHREADRIFKLTQFQASDSCHVRFYELADFT